MKKSFAFAALLLGILGYVASASADFSVTQAELSPGVYTNVPADAATKALTVVCLAGCSAGSGVVSGNVVTVQPSGLSPGASQIPLSTKGELFVACTTGCSAGSGAGANNTDGVSVVGTGLGQAQDFLYGFNGSTWDRLRVDGSKNLDVALGAAIPAGSNTIGNVNQAGTWTVTVSGTVPVSGTVTVNAGTGTFNNQQSNITSDYDTGAGTQTMTMYGIALPASGGAVPGGTATNPIQVSLANTAANGTAIKVDGSAVTQPVSIAGTPNVNAIQSGGWSVSISGTAITSDLADGSVGAGAAGTKSSLAGCVFNTALPTLTNTQQVAEQCDSSGRRIVVVATLPSVTVGTLPALVAGAANIGSVVPAAGVGSGSAVARAVLAASNNSTNVKGSAATVYGLQASNDDTVPYYVKLYNKATAPTCGSDTPVAGPFEIPANSSGTNIMFGTPGMSFGTGLGYCVTKGITDADNTSLVANKAALTLQYQ